MNTDNSGPLPFYTRKVEELRTGASQALERYRLCRKRLLALGLIAIALFYLSFRAKGLRLWTPFLALPFAISLGNQAGHPTNDRWRFSRLREYYETGIARLTRNWELLEDGKNYLDGRHSGLNVHFSDTGGSDTLDFDYKLRPRPAEPFQRARHRAPAGH